MKITCIYCSVLLFLLFGANLLVARNVGTCRGHITFDSTYVISINKSLPKYYISLIEREDTSGKYTGWNYELLFRTEVNGQIEQSICGESDSPFDMMSDEEYPGIQFIDLNFDDYLDIKMFNNRSANGVNAGYAVYLFSPLNHGFKYSKAFSAILGGTGINLNPSKHEIISSGELGCMGGCWSTDTYKVQDDSLILIKRVHQDRDPNNPGKFILITEEMRNGKLIIISKKGVKWP